MVKASIPEIKKNSDIIIEEAWHIIILYLFSYKS